MRVTLVGDEWGSSKGGLSTLNRELAKNLALQPGVEVTILLPFYSGREKQEANDCQVSLATPEPMTGFDSIRGLSFPKEDHYIDVVIGHGQKLGAPAQVIAKQRKCKRVHVVHTASEELAMFKEGETTIPKGGEKRHAEVDLCEEAHIVVAIGPKLKEDISSKLRFRKDKCVIGITPGIFQEFAKVEQASEKEGRFRILVFGRGDSKDFELKGYDIAAKAVASLKDENFLLFFVGAPKGKEEEVKKELLKCEIPLAQLIVRGFIESREEVKKLLCEVDLAIMPSRTEGFGLTALEALSAGLPILVGSNSGFGQAIRKLEFESSCVVCSDDPEKWGEAIRNVRDTPRNLRLKNALSLRKSYDKMYNWGRQCKKLVDRMRQILE